MRDLYLVNIWGIYGKNKVRYTIEGSKSDRNGKYNSQSGKHTGASDILQFYSSRLGSLKPIWAMGIDRNRSVITSNDLIG